MLAHDRGTGKTISALSLAKHNKAHALVVVPKTVRRKWEREAKLVGAEVTVISRDEFRRTAHIIDGSNIDAIIIDEAHFGFASMQAQLHKKTLAFIKRWSLKYTWLLTGTPYTSTPWSVYGLARLLGHGWDYHKFRGRFFREQWYGRRSVWVPKEGTQDELAQMVNLIGNVVPLAECADIPEQVYEIELFEKSIPQLEAEEHVKLNESNPLVRTTKYHQIASGVRIGNEFTADETFECEKNDRIMEYAEENKKLVIFSRYNLHLSHLSALLTERGIPHAIINGETEDKEAIIEQAQKAERFVVLINASCSVGYELTTFDTVLFASLSYSFVDYVQAQGRVLRINALKKNLYVIMLTEDSVDEAVWESIRDKQSFNDTIFSSTKLNEYES